MQELQGFPHQSFSQARITSIISFPKVDSVDVFLRSFRSAAVGTALGCSVEGVIRGLWWKGNREGGVESQTSVRQLDSVIHLHCFLAFEPSYKQTGRSPLHVQEPHLICDWLLHEERDPSIQVMYFLGTVSEVRTPEEYILMPSNIYSLALNNTLGDGWRIKTKTQEWWSIDRNSSLRAVQSDIKSIYIMMFSQPKWECQQGELGRQIPAWVSGHWVHACV